MLVNESYSMFLSVNWDAFCLQTILIMILIRFLFRFECSFYSNTKNSVRNNNVEYYRQLLFFSCHQVCYTKFIIYVYTPGNNTLFCNVIFVFRFQSTPVGSLQTGQEIIVSPNRDRHPYKVRI